MRTAIAAISIVGLLASTAGAAGIEEFNKACTSSTNLGPEICACTGKNAQTDLSGDGFDFLVATLAGEQATVDALRRKLGMQELMKASLYMTKGPSKCAAAAAPAE